MLTILNNLCLMSMILIFILKKHIWIYGLLLRAVWRNLFCTLKLVYICRCMFYPWIRHLSEDAKTVILILCASTR